MIVRCMCCMETFEEEIGVCPHCGYPVGIPAEAPFLIPPKTILYNRYIVGKVLGYGGFGVTYVGWDTKLEQKVAIKEYLPTEFSTRIPGQTQVTIMEGDKHEQFVSGMNKFVEEAKRLAKFQNQPGIVNIFDAFTENDTAYIIMEYLEGESLKDYLDEVGTIPEDTAVEMLMPIMKSLELVHKAGMLHRDIAPDNIFITKKGEPKLIDFGASRYATTSHSRSLTIIVKQGYSPEEQYRSRGDQGPYTDVYALAATLYRMITGKIPPDAMERRARYENANKDILVAPHKYAKKISVAREHAILNALNVRVEDRTQTVAEFINELQADPPAKRRYGKIKKIDFYAMPLWVKIAVPALLAVAAVFVTLILTGVINITHFKKKIEIPDGYVKVADFGGMSVDAAMIAIKEAGLNMSVAGQLESEYIPVGTIMVQTPNEGTYVRTNSKLEIVLSAGVADENTIPFIQGMSLSKVKAELDARGLSYSIIEMYDDYTNEGLVMAQPITELYETEDANELRENINAGKVTVVNAGTRLELLEGNLYIYVSKGSKPFELENFNGWNYAEVIAKINELGLQYEAIPVSSDTVDVGVVINQNPAAGQLVKIGDVVYFYYVDKINTYELVNVVGMTEKDAKKALSKFNVITNYEYSESVAEGLVISQDPTDEITNSLVLNAVVTINVSKGKKPITVSFNIINDIMHEDTVIVYFGETYSTLPNVERKGYEFMGWYLEPGGDGERITEETAVEKNTNHVLYAYWTAERSNLYELSDCVVFDEFAGIKSTAWSQDGKMMSEEFIKSLKPGSVIEIEYKCLKSDGKDYYGLDEFVWIVFPNAKKGWMRVGWSTNDTHLFAKFNDSKTISQITYEQIVEVCGPYIIEERSYIRDGKEVVEEVPTWGRIIHFESDFDWEVVSVKIGQRLDAGSTQTPTAAPTATPTSAPKTYTVVFNGNGSTSGSMKSQTMTYDNSAALLANSFVRTGYKFIGWSTSKTATKGEYSNQQVVRNLTATNGATVTLYAVWEAVVCSHSWQYDSTIKAANCTTGGEERDRCSICGEYRTRTTVAIEHNKTAVVGKPATCTEKGWSEGVKCTVCGWTDVIELPVIDHTFADDGKDDKCKACGYIRASWYTVLYVSSNGTDLGNKKIKIERASSVTVKAPEKAGYSVPANATVKWSATNSRTVKMIYEPIAVSDAMQDIDSGIWSTYAGNTVISYDVKAEYRNRTSNTVEVRVFWTNTIHKGYYSGYKQLFTFIDNKEYEIVDASTWSKSKRPDGKRPQDSKSVYSDWVTFSVDATDTTVELYGKWWHAENNGTWSGNIVIPAY